VTGQVFHYQGKFSTELNTEDLIISEVNHSNSSTITAIAYFLYEVFVLHHYIFKICLSL
jgi:hypothetical protein